MLLSNSWIIHRGGKPRSQQSDRAFVDKVSALLRHCTNTFGANEVERWGVEIGTLHDEIYIRYLQDIVHPHRPVRCQECKNGSSKLTLQMLSHEVKFLILIREL